MPVTADEPRIAMGRPTGVAWPMAATLCVLVSWASMAVAQPAATPAPAAAPAPAVEEGKCGLLVDTPDGKGTFEPKADLHPISQTGPGKAFIVDAPVEAAVMCGRTSIIPMPYDIQVAMTGHLFYIIDKQSDRIGVLEVNEGQCEYRLVKGVLTADEEKLLQPRLDEMQQIAAAAAP